MLKSKGLQIKFDDLKVCGHHNELLSLLVLANWSDYESSGGR